MRKISSQYGISTKQEQKDESFIEVEYFTFYSTSLEGNKRHMQLYRFPLDHVLPKLVTQIPNIGFKCKIIFIPCSSLEGYRVAMIEEQSIPVWLAKTILSDQEISALEQKNAERRIDIWSILDFPLNYIVLRG